LIRNGISADAIKTISYGKEKPSARRATKLLAAESPRPSRLSEVSKVGTLRRPHSLYRAHAQCTSTCKSRQKVALLAVNLPVRLAPF
jgi:Outer membrane protein and related peptidoglycan-associated (lipo)proteins